MLKKKLYIPNARESMGNTYYVSQKHPKASDANPGTKKFPFKTIAKAASLVDMSDIVVIDEGVYREEVPILKHGHTYIPTSLVIFKAAPGKKVYLKGSDPFDPQWQAMGEGVYQAKLPESLFEKGVYNPYELSCVVDEPGRVRPCAGPDLPETLGQIYVDGEPLDQANSLEAVRQTPGTFVVSAGGREILVHLDGNLTPKGRDVELTVRQRCFKPIFPGTLFIQTMGMVVEHDAEPGAFSKCRPLSIRKNPGTGIVVRKTPGVPGNTDYYCNLMGNVSYVGNNQPTMISGFIDDVTACSFAERKSIPAISADGGKKWKPLTKGGIKLNEQTLPAHFFDETNDRLIQYYGMFSGNYLDGVGGTWEHFIRYSADHGKTWSKPEKYGASGNNRYYYRIIRLKDGTLLWVYTENQLKTGYHARMGAMLGQWNADLTEVNWKQGGILEIDPLKSSGGLDEPQACQFPDGRIFVILRQGNIRTTQEHPGVPSLKLFSISGDNGQTWSEPQPLVYEDGKYVYSTRSFPDVLCSTRNKRVYVILNISDHSADNCDPRTTLHIAEFDTGSLRVKRKTIAIVDTKLEEHHYLVRFSNWSSIQDRYTGNLILFMKLHMSEYCPIRNGYDANTYRYEIQFPA